MASFAWMSFPRERSSVSGSFCRERQPLIRILYLTWIFLYFSRAIYFFNPWSAIQNIWSWLSNSCEIYTFDLSFIGKLTWSHFYHADNILCYTFDFGNGMFSHDCCHFVVLHVSVRWDSMKKSCSYPYIIIYGRREIYWITVTFPKTLEFQLNGVDDHDETVKY